MYQYQYLYPDSLDFSSGTLLCLPEYIGSYNILMPAFCSWITISSGSNYPLESTQSSYVGYKYVTELLGQNGEFGKNVYRFRSPDEAIDIIGLNFPFPPDQSREWERGQTLNVKSYRYDSLHNTYQLVQEKGNGFGYLTTDIFTGLKVSRALYAGTGVLLSPTTSDWAVAQYGTEVGWVPMMVDTATLYDQNNQASSTQKLTSYTYSDVHFQPLTATTTNSNGDTVVTHMSYPLDYSGLSGADGLTQGVLALQN